MLNTLNKKDLETPVDGTCPELRMGTDGCEQAAPPALDEFYSLLDDLLANLKDNNAISEIEYAGLQQKLKAAIDAAGEQLYCKCKEQSDAEAAAVSATKFEDYKQQLDESASKKLKNFYNVIKEEQANFRAKLLGANKNLQKELQSTQQSFSEYKDLVAESKKEQQKKFRMLLENVKQAHYQELDAIEQQRCKQLKQLNRVFLESANKMVAKERNRKPREAQQVLEVQPR